MALRTQLKHVRQQVDQMRSVTEAQKTDYVDDAAGLMTAGGHPPDAWQADVLDATEDTLLCVTRQGGKSETTAAKALHTALYRPYSLTVILAPSLRQSQELYHKVRHLHRVTGEIVATEEESALRLQLANHSRIVVLPGSEKTARGYTPDLVIIDEAARVPDELFHALRPMLAVSKGQMIALSTPWGKRGWFYREFVSDSDDWKRVRVTAKECPRITDEFLEREKRSLPLPIFESEYMCHFGETIDSVFRMQDILEAFTDEVEPFILDEIAA